MVENPSFMLAAVGFTGGSLFSPSARAGHAAATETSITTTALARMVTLRIFRVGQPPVEEARGGGATILAATIEFSAISTVEPSRLRRMRTPPLHDSNTPTASRKPP